MTESEQTVFVFTLMRMIEDEVVSLIENGSVPPEWDGHELRVLLSDKFRDSARLSDLRKHPHGKRNKDYNNWKAVTPGV